MGTTTTRIVVGEFAKGEKDPKILGVGEAPTSGMRHGYVTNFDEVLATLERAKTMAEHSSGIKIKRAYVGIGSVTVRGDMSTGVAIISKSDGEVTTLDINKALEESEENLNLGNRKIVGVFPIAYKLDGKEVQGRPEGMHGNKLEVKAIFVTCSSQHLDDLLEVIAEAGIEPIDVIPDAIAGSYIALSERQKVVGGALVDIGAESVSMAVFENGTLLSLHTFSIGAVDITNDIALGLKITLEDAEKLKLGGHQGHSQRKLDEIIEARLSDIFELVENHLKKIKRSELLPAGVVFIGGGANTQKLEEHSKYFLKLPSKIGSTDMFGNAKTKLRDPAWFTALGLLKSGKQTISYSSSSPLNIFKDLKNSIKSITKQLLP